MNGGFSVNNEIMQINMKERSFISESLIYDFIHAIKIIIEDYKFPDELMKFVKTRSARRT